jgi:hypothetical protein
MKIPFDRGSLKYCDGEVFLKQGGLGLPLLADRS